MMPEIITVLLVTPGMTEASASAAAAATSPAANSMSRPSPRFLLAMRAKVPTSKPTIDAAAMSAYEPLKKTQIAAEASEKAKGSRKPG